MLHISPHAISLSKHQIFVGNARCVPVITRDRETHKLRQGRSSSPCIIEYAVPAATTKNTTRVTNQDLPKSSCTRSSHGMSKSVSCGTKVVKVVFYSMFLPRYEFMKGGSSNLSRQLCQRIHK